MKVFRFERKSEPLASRWTFARRIALSFGLALFLVLTVLLIGMGFYHSLRPTSSWAQAFHRASMILSGMGTVEGDPTPTDFERIFAGLYALFSSLIVVTAIGLIVTPILHRGIHHFHLEDDGDSDDEKTASPPQRAQPERRKASKRKPRRKTT